MMEGLTLSLAFFFLFVLIPGYAGLWAAGRLGEARRGLHSALYRGVTNFGLMIFIFLLVSPREARIFLDALAGNAAGVTALRLAGWSVGFYFPAMLLGLVDHLFALRFALSVKASRAWRRFLIGGAAFEVSPRDDMLWEMFLCYRAVGKRPLVRITLEEGGSPLEGEVLKVSSGIEPGMLVADMDSPQDISWVPMRRVKAVEFVNPGVKPECGMLDHKTRELLNMIHPGYGDEVEERHWRRLASRHD